MNEMMKNARNLNMNLILKMERNPKVMISFYTDAISLCSVNNVFSPNAS